MHYPSTVRISDSVGASVASYVNLNFMLPVRGPEAAEQNIRQQGDPRR